MISILMTQTITEAAQANDTLKTVFIVLGVVSGIFLVVSMLIKKNQKLMSILRTIGVCGCLIAVAGFVVEKVKDSATEASVVSSSVQVNHLEYGSQD